MQYWLTVPWKPETKYLFQGQLSKAVIITFITDGCHRSACHALCVRFSWTSTVKIIIGLLIHGCREFIVSFYSFPSQTDLMQKKIKGRFTYASQRAMRFRSAASDPFIDVDTVTLRQKIYSVHALTFRSKDSIHGMLSVFKVSYIYVIG